MGNPFAKPQLEVKDNPLKADTWRPFNSWNTEQFKTLVSNIKDFKTGLQVKNVRLFVLGPVGAGKSSFINSVASIDAGCISSPVEAGSDASSLTKNLVVYRPDTRLRGFRLIDTMGVEEAQGKGFHVNDAANIIKGHLKTDYRFQQMSAADESSQYFVKNPKTKDKAHCVLYFMDARVLENDSVTTVTKDKIKALQDEIKKTGVKQILIITSIDCLCPAVKKDLTKVYRSKRVERAVLQGMEMFGLPALNVFPVENYHNDVNMDFRKDILLLHALRQAMIFSKDYLRMEADKVKRHDSSDED